MYTRVFFVALLSILLSSCFRSAQVPEVSEREYFSIRDVKSCSPRLPGDESEITFVSSSKRDLAKSYAYESFNLADLKPDKLYVFGEGVILDLSKATSGELQITTPAFVSVWVQDSQGRWIEGNVLSRSPLCTAMSSRYYLPMPSQKYQQVWIVFAEEFSLFLQPLH